jgi:hypothetical protein
MSEYAPHTFTGKVFKKELKRGAVNAIQIEGGGEIVLRQDGKSALEDNAFDAVMGKTITATGTLTSYVLLVDSWSEKT